MRNLLNGRQDNCHFAKKLLGQRGPLTPRNLLLACHTISTRNCSTHPYSGTCAAFAAAKPVSTTSQGYWGATFSDAFGGVGVVGPSGSFSSKGPDVVSQIQEFNSQGAPDRSFGLMASSELQHLALTILTTPTPCFRTTISSSRPTRMNRVRM